jgi:hypothetical protein
VSKLDELSSLLDKRGIGHVRSNSCVFSKNCRVMEYVAERDGRPEHLNEPIVGLVLEVFNLTPAQVADVLEVIA